MLQANHCYWLRRTKKNDIVENRVRQEGGGRPLAEIQFKDMDEVFLFVISEHIAGDPMDENIKWVKLTRHQISISMNKLGILASRNIVRKLLKKHGFIKRKIQRRRLTGVFQNREQQFRNIEKVRKKFMNSRNPVLSIDTKKKEKLGDLYRAGSVYCTQAIETYDHDFEHLSKGTIVPHGIYDIKRNEAAINIGFKNETAEFICDSIKAWWNKTGKTHYKDATEILIFCDAGGANSYRHHRFKVALQDLTNAIKLPIRICHYPPYTSKWNPIEHRVFPHVTRAMEGVKLESIEDAKNLIKNTETKSGLRVFVSTTNKIYKTGLKVAKEALEKIKIKKHGELWRLNYTIAPMVGVI